MTLVETAHAKINVALHVRRKRDDGYHEIETVFAFAQDGDTLAASEDDTLSLAITGPFANRLSTGDDNLVLRAAEALRRQHGVATGARLVLDKRLPVASGIGGGSADAAAALRLLGRLWDVPVDPALAPALGADVPACLLSRTAWADGFGHQLRPIAPDRLAGTAMLLVNPGVPISTAAVFAGWGGIDHGPLDAADPIAAAIAGRNDLEPPARRMAPVIDELLGCLKALPGVRLARMSGSGATCFALFEDASDRDRAAEFVRTAFPRAWLLATALRERERECERSTAAVAAGNSAA